MSELKLNGNQLKLIAVISMLVDHVAFILYHSYFMYSPVRENVFWGLRGVGRIAFPIYAFFLVEGFCHTRSWKKYAGRLLICGVISEIPYNYMVSGNFLFSGAQNIFWTLFLGLLMMKGLQMVMIRYPGMTGRQLQLAIIVICCAVAWVFRMDYDYRGIMLIGLFCWFYGDMKQQSVVGVIWMVLTAGIAGSSGALTALGYGVAFFLIQCYNGSRGTWNGKVFFYGFYPVHLIILDVISTIFRL